VDEAGILEGLNPEQRRAAEAVRGPVCILAGAGSGKTTTITRRIAWQVASGAVRSDQILAVTFTDKAAAEMRTRLERLGVAGVEARTFHSAALSQLRRARGDAPGRILSTKALLLRQIGNTLPPPYRFRPAGDLATEVEWAKNRRLTPQTYRSGLGTHEPPIRSMISTRPGGVSFSPTAIVVPSSATESARIWNGATSVQVPARSSKTWMCGIPSPPPTTQ